MARCRPALHVSSETTGIQCRTHSMPDAMNKAEFDKFAQEYQQVHAANIAISGEGPDILPSTRSATWLG